MASDCVPIADQVLLTASSGPTFRKEISNDNVGRETSTASGRKFRLCLGCSEKETFRFTPRLSLNAVADGPRLRLLWASFLRIEGEVINISNYGISNLDDYLTDFSDVIWKACQPVCMSWLEAELHLLNREPTKALVTLMDGKVNGDNTVSVNIRNSGKEDLYGELMCFLSFGALREGCCYDRSLFKKARSFHTGIFGDKFSRWDSKHIFGAYFC